MGLLNQTFGEAGTAQAYFGGEWWLVGILIVGIFMLYFHSRGIPVEGLTLFLFASILLVSIDGLFSIPQNIFMPIVIMVLIYHSIKVYRELSR